MVAVCAYLTVTTRRPVFWRCLEVSMSLKFDSARRTFFVLVFSMSQQHNSAAFGSIKILKMHENAQFAK